ncbi:GNAT family N-acetyltransferase [Catellatospora tritici]|uniref:GNAT family N-acetyltransferase n=1 Tax=Catellatospora tritici TaxID=2851566 RepID=UPI001C2D18A0|nr:GNAT family N-acetyltransferase [Catellatospora tritici]MBV1850726.1 GNAT family N-acetyltransferase [Catellatospora tritici]MBV1850979.1 GNAT family N-acetyltransferase [Catellatospora tritici]
MNQAVVHLATAQALLPSGWDGLAGPDDVFLTGRWLRVVEAVHATAPRYLWCERGGRITAGLATIVADASAPWVMGRPDAIVAASVSASRAGAARLLDEVGGDPATLLPSLALGGRHIGHTRVLHDGTDPAGDTRLLLDAAADLARESGCVSLALPYLDETDHGLESALAARGWRSCVVGRYHRLAVPADGFSGWLAGLTSKRRNSVAAERRRVAAAGVRIARTTVAGLPDLVAAARLEAGLLGRYGIEWPVERAASILSLVGGQFGDDAIVLAAYAGDALVGFTLVLAYGDQWYARQAGFDYSFQRTHRAPLYFELCYYRMLELAADAGIRTIHYGLGSEDAKMWRGCVSTEQRCWVGPVAPAEPGKGGAP